MTNFLPRVYAQLLVHGCHGEQLGSVGVIINGLV